MGWATDIKGKLDSWRSDAVAAVEIIDAALPELEEGSPEKVGAQDIKAEINLIISLIDAALLIVTPFA